MLPSSCNAHYVGTYLHVVFVWEEAEPRALSRHGSGRDNCGDDVSTEPADPRYRHAHRRRPVLLVGGMVLDLEIAFQRDHHQTDLFAEHQQNRS